MGAQSMFLPFLFSICMETLWTQIILTGLNNRSCPKVKVHCIYKEKDLCDKDSNFPASQKCCLFSCGRKGTNFSKVICKLPADPGPCLASMRCWVYDDDIKDCATFFYWGCDRNYNNFQTQEICRKTCKALGKYRKPCCN